MYPRERTFFKDSLFDDRGTGNSKRQSNSLFQTSDHSSAHRIVLKCLQGACRAGIVTFRYLALQISQSSDDSTSGTVDG